MNQDDYFILPEGIQFGFNDKYYDERVLSVVDNRLTVIRCNNGKITGGVVFGEKPLMGLAEVEIEILTSSTGKRVSSSLLFGVMRCKKGTIPYQGHNKLSRYDIDISTEKNHLIWSENKQLWNLLGAKIELNTSYGIVNLKDLEEGDRLGLQIQENGDLYYFVNGMCQGLAAHHVYQKGWDVYHVVDISNDHYGIKITKAGRQLGEGHFSYLATPYQTESFQGG